MSRCDLRRDARIIVTCSNENDDERGRGNNDRGNAHPPMRGRVVSLAVVHRRDVDARLDDACANLKRSGWLALRETPPQRPTATSASLTAATCRLDTASHSPTGATHTPQPS